MAVFSVTDSVYDKLKDTKNPQGLAAMVPFFSHTMEDVRTLPKEKSSSISKTSRTREI